MNGRLDDDILLKRLGDWLRDARAAADALGPVDAGDGPDAQPVGLIDLIEEFTALRHEIKLQTKGTRGLQEETEALLPALRQAIDQFRSVEPREAQAAWSAGRPLAEALAELDEALDRARAEVDKARRRPAERDDERLAALDGLFDRQSGLFKPLIRSYHEHARELLIDDQADPAGDLLDALAQGYDLVRARIRRALDAEDIRRIDAVGRPVDPETMTVVGVVDDPDAEPGTVVEEVRRGYRWKGRVLRFAEVRAAREAPADFDSSTDEDDED